MSVPVVMLAVGLVAFQASTDKARVRETGNARVRLAQQVALDPDILKAVAESNARKESLDSVRSKDASWVSDARYPLKRLLLAAPCSVKLKSLVSADPLIVEAFAMDARGALVCTIGETSDYWQGDEAKWQRTFTEGRPEFVDEPAFDASSGTHAIQVSVPLVDGGQRTGALTLTLKLRWQGDKAKRD